MFPKIYIFTLFYRILEVLAVGPQCLCLPCIILPWICVCNWAYLNIFPMHFLILHPSSTCLCHCHLYAFPKVRLIYIAYLQVLLARESLFASLSPPEVWLHFLERNWGFPKRNWGFVKTAMRKIQFLLNFLPTLRKFGISKMSWRRFLDPLACINTSTRPYTHTHKKCSYRHA